MHPLIPKCITPFSPTCLNSASPVADPFPSRLRSADATLRGQRGGNRREHRDGNVKYRFPNLLVHFCSFFKFLVVKVVRSS